MSSLENLSSSIASDASESTPEDLGTLRWMLDLALQPLERFDGFTRIDQVALAAWRYQLNYLQYALAKSQYTRTPAFTGYLAEAQRNLIEKMCDRRVWGYWFWQNLLLNLRWNSDPVIYQNVMYTGFFGTMLGLYETLNDDARFSQPGALRLHRHTRAGHADHLYDFPQLAAAIRHNMEISPFTLYPCEPHLVYPMCNVFALDAVHQHDRLRGTHVMGDLVSRVRAGFSEHRFLRSDGRFIAGRGPIGFNFGVANGNDMIVAYWLHALMPDLARATWLRIRDHQITRDGNTITMPIHGTDRFDAGNYTRNPVMMRALVIACAREMGDEEIACALEQELPALDTQATPVRETNAADFATKSVATAAHCFANTSVLGNAACALARFSRANGMRNLLNGADTESARRGPLLTAAAYPDVLVARAVNDAESLALVLRPGNGECKTTLQFGRLQPGGHYRAVCSGGGKVVVENLQASATGEATLEMELTARCELRLQPAPAG